MIGKLIQGALGSRLFAKSRLFATLSTVFTVLRLLQKVAGVGPKTLYTHKVKPGEVVVIRGPQRKPQ